MYTKKINRGIEVINTCRKTLITNDVKMPFIRAWLVGANMVETISVESFIEYRLKYGRQGGTQFTEMGCVDD